FGTKAARGLALPGRRRTFDQVIGRPDFVMSQRFLLATGLIVVGAGAATIAMAASGVRPSCVTVTSDAFYRNYGYDHVVHVTNGCAGAVVCAVSTDVNPEPQRLSVPPKTTADVLTFRGSPARSFVPRVDCHEAR